MPLIYNQFVLDLKINKYNAYIILDNDDYDELQFDYKNIKFDVLY